MAGSDSARLVIGDGPAACELHLDANSLRLLVQQTTAAIAEMDVLFEQAEAVREVAGTG